MKLLRLKITDDAGFRSLPAGFEHWFQPEWCWGDNPDATDDGFAPFVCAGPNGSGKSNLLEALAAIFYQLDIQRNRRNFLPPALLGDDDDITDKLADPDAFELEYLIEPLIALPTELPRYAHVRIDKQANQSPRMRWLNARKFGDLTATLPADGLCGDEQREFLLPAHVLGYSSGENEILSLPFFKMRFVKLDEYLAAMRGGNRYTTTRLAYLDKSFSQAILLCLLLMEDPTKLTPLRDTIGIGELTECRIVLRRFIPLTATQVAAFADDERAALDAIIANHPALSTTTDEIGQTRYQLDILHLLQGDNVFLPTIDLLQRCATLHYENPDDGTLILDYYINDATRQAFKANFNDSPLKLFKTLQILLTLNLHTVSDALKNDLYQSDSAYVTETVPVLASDERVMRFKNFWFTKHGIDKPVLLKYLSDGEHQLIHALGLCLLFAGSNSLFLLDEPGTHFNPTWRARFVKLLCECLAASTGPNKERPPRPEMLMTTHSPFPISDSEPRKVLVFDKEADTGAVGIHHPEFNTLGASINKITMTTFGQGDTVGGVARTKLDALRKRCKAGEDVDVLLEELENTLGDSVEKILLAKAMADTHDEATD